MLRFLIILLSISLTGCSHTLREHTQLENRVVEPIYIVDGGDGDQGFFSLIVHLRKTDVQWPRSEHQFYEATEFEVLNTKFKGQRVLVTMRGEAAFEDIIEEDGYTLTVLDFVIKNPETGKKELSPIGYGALFSEDEYAKLEAERSGDEGDSI